MTEKLYVELKLKDQLRLLLKENDLTAAQLARKSGISKQTLSNWLSGESPRKLEDVHKVAKFFSVSLEELLFAEHPPVKNGGSNFLDIVNGQEMKGIFEVSIKKIK